jgi:hypothetical protein
MVIFTITTAMGEKVARNTEKWMPLQASGGTAITAI